MTGGGDWRFLRAVGENQEQRTQHTSTGTRVLLGDSVRAKGLFSSWVPGEHVSETLMGVHRKA